MTAFTVRVELHEANDADYTNLHKRMEAKGFVRWVKNRDGVKFRLPTAEYSLTGSYQTTDQVRDLAKAVAESVKPRPKPWVLVTKSSGRAWAGLEEWDG